MKNETKIKPFARVDIFSNKMYVCSNFEGDASTLELGSEIECTIAPGNSGRGNGGCIAADHIRPLPKNTIPRPTPVTEVLDGTVVRPLRSTNPDQVEYTGLIKINPTTEDEETPEYEFGIMSLVNKRERLQVGEPVQLQVSGDEVKIKCTMNR